MKLVSRVNLSLCFAAVAAVCLAGDAAWAADNIAGFLDSSGRVVFVNEPSEAVALSPAQTSSQRRLIAKASADSMHAAAAQAFGDSPLTPAALNPAAVAPAGAWPQRSGRNQIHEMVSEAARRHQVDADLVHAIVQVESNYNPYATSHKGARGLMQLIPATARRFGVSNSYDPSANLDGGIRYLKYLMGMFNGDLRLSLAAYNAGEMAVSRNGGVPPYRETQDYIRKISELYPMRTVAAAAGIAPEPQIVRYLDAGGVVHFSNTDTP